MSSELSYIAAEYRVLVVDHDQVARNLVINCLSATGFSDVVPATDGQGAWLTLSNDPNFSLIVLDWKLPGGLSGLALYNRIRSLPAYRTTPILVVSGFVERNDFRLLQEFPCTALVEKPFTNSLLQISIEDLLKESVWYGQNEALIDSLLEAVKGNGKTAEQLIKQVLKKAPKPMPLALLAAKRLVKNKLLKSAKAILESVLKVDDQSLIALNEMGKVMHMMGKHEQALGYLRQASDLSPQCIPRLCLMGEVELNLNDPEGARKSFQKALHVDAEHVKAQQGLILADNMNDLFAAPAALQVPSSFASLMNTMGIAYVRNRNFARGIGQYQAALNFLPDGEDRARVAFNLGLGYLRWGKPGDALIWFQRSEAEHQGSGNRSASYVRKLLLKESSTLTEQVVPEADLQRDVPSADAVASNVIPFPTATKAAVASGEAGDYEIEEAQIRL